MGTTVTWSFTVQVYADMSDTAGCSDCHAGYPAAHPMTDCMGCHAVDGPFPAYWNMDDPQVHSTSFIADVDCSYCHSSVWAVRAPPHR